MAGALKPLLGSGSSRHLRDVEPGRAVKGRHVSHGWQRVAAGASGPKPAACLGSMRGHPATSGRVGSCSGSAPTSCSRARAARRTAPRPGTTGRVKKYSSPLTYGLPLRLVLRFVDSLHNGSDEHRCDQRVLFGVVLHVSLVNRHVTGQSRWRG